MPFTGGNTVIIDGTVTVSGAVETDRKTTSVTLTISSGSAVSDAVDMRDYGGGIIHMPAGWTAADLGAQTSASSGGTYQDLVDGSNAYGTDVAVEDATASNDYPIPPFWFGAHYLKLHSQNTDGTGADVNQAADRTVVIDLKS